VWLRSKRTVVISRTRVAGAQRCSKLTPSQPDGEQLALEPQVPRLRYAVTLDRHRQPEEAAFEKNTLPRWKSRSTSVRRRRQRATEQVLVPDFANDTSLVLSQVFFPGHIFALPIALHAVAEAPVRGILDRHHRPHVLLAAHRLAHRHGLDVHRAEHVRLSKSRLQAID
jgi:hypothetical protein